MSVILDEVRMRIKYDRCPNCGSDRLEIVWQAVDPEIVTYTCLDCKAITKEAANVRSSFQ